MINGFNGYLTLYLANTKFLHVFIRVVYVHRIGIKQNAQSHFISVLGSNTDAILSLFKRSGPGYTLYLCLFSLQRPFLQIYKFEHPKLIFQAKCA